MINGSVGQTGETIDDVNINSNMLSHDGGEEVIQGYSK